MSLQPGLSVVIPVYRSAAGLGELVDRLERALGAHPAWELILVDDGSPDESSKVIQSLAATRRFVHGISLMRNYGQHNAILCGIRAARFDTIVTLDDDLQNPPEEIANLLAALTSDVDVVYGTPEREQHGLFRDLASVVTKMVLQGAMGATTARKVSAFRVFRTRLREAFADYRSPFVSIDVLLTWATTKFVAIRVRHDPRAVGQSNYTLRKLVIHALNMLTGFSTRPLRIASLLGFGFTFFGFVIFAFVLIRYLTFGTVVPGFAFLASIVAILSGAQLFTLGIIGEYIGRLHLRLMERPTYAVLSEVHGSSRAGLADAAPSRAVPPEGAPTKP
jgi:undecaprenyl-phosphate 4-deoxy-4-formamido-L-arabinose transferase